MNCPKCNSPLNENDLFCQQCGAAVTKSEPTVEQTEQKPTAFYSASQQYQNGPSQQYAYSAPAYTSPQRREITEDELPPRFKPLGAWKYFAYQLLFSIPIVGFVFLIVFSCNGSNINRRNFARSYWCGLVVVAALFAVIMTLMLIFGLSMSELVR